MRGHGADAQHGLIGGNSLQLRDAAQIDHVLGLLQPKLHRRNKTVTAGEQLRFVAILRVEPQGFAQIRWPVVVERCGNHVPLCPLSRVSPRILRAAASTDLMMP